MAVKTEYAANLSSNRNRIAAKFCSEVFGWPIYQVHFNEYEGEYEEVGWAGPCFLHFAYDEDRWEFVCPLQSRDEWTPDTDANQLRVVKAAIHGKGWAWATHTAKHVDGNWFLYGSILEIIHTHVSPHKMGPQWESKTLAMSVHPHSDLAEHDAILECVKQLQESS